MKKYLKLFGYILLMLIFVGCFLTVLNPAANAGDRAGAGAVMLLLFLWDKFDKAEKDRAALLAKLDAIKAHIEQSSK